MPRPRVATDDPSGRLAMTSRLNDKQTENETHHHGDEPQHNVLEVDEPFDVSKAVACPLKMGGATFHHSETLHYTAPNTTGTPRLAFPMEFQITPVRRSKPVSMPWMDEFRKATGGGDKIYHVADGRISEI